MIKVGPNVSFHIPLNTFEVLGCIWTQLCHFKTFNVSVYSYHFAYFPLNELRPISFKETREILIFWPKWLYFAPISPPMVLLCQGEFFNILDLGYFGPQGAVMPQYDISHQRQGFFQSQESQNRTCKIHNTVSFTIFHQ